jgi:hypothetical protein
MSAAQQGRNQNLLTTKDTEGHRGKSKATPKPKPQARGQKGTTEGTEKHNKREPVTILRKKQEIYG